MSSARRRMSRACPASSRHIGSTRSGAPFTAIQVAPSRSRREAAKARSDSNGIAPVSGHARHSALRSTPPFAASDNSATSVGSPRLEPWPWWPMRSASLHATATSSAVRNASSTGPGSLPSHTRPSASCSSRTVSSLHVSVPVLSEAMSVQLPSPSTAGRLRTIAPRAAMRRAAIASVTVSATGSPSGIAETASATPNTNIVPTLSPRSITPRSPMMTAPASTTTATTRAKRSIRVTSGGLPPSVADMVSASPPTTVRAPVATTRPRARPRTTVDPACARSARSSSGGSGPGRDATPFATGTDSPVRSASSTSSPCASMSCRSAGTRWPLSSATTSPGTSCSASISTVMPSRSTVARTRSSRCRLRLCCSARHSCQAPSAELMTRTTPMKAASVASPSASATAAAAMST